MQLSPLLLLTPCPLIFLSLSICTPLRFKLQVAICPVNSHPPFPPEYASMFTFSSPNLGNSRSLWTSFPSLKVHHVFRSRSSMNVYVRLVNDPPSGFLPFLRWRRMSAPSVSYLCWLGQDAGGRDRKIEKERSKALKAGIWSAVQQHEREEGESIGEEGGYHRALSTSGEACLTSTEQTKKHRTK